MAYDLYCHIFDPTTKSYPDGNKVTPDGDMKTAGQDGGIAKENQHSEFKPDQGWFRLISYEYTAAAAAQVGAGVSVGNVTEANLKFTKLTGPNTAIAYRCLYERTPVNVEIRVQNRKGGTENQTMFTFIFEDAVFTRITTTTGDIHQNNAQSVTTFQRDDLTEIDKYELVYQAVQMETGNKKKVRLSAQRSK